MPSDNPALRFQDILDNIARIEGHVAGLNSASDFTRDTLRQDAVERCLSRISEAVVKLGEQASVYAPEIPWHDIRGIGNILRHAYDGVDPDILWNTVRHELPTLKAACEKALEDMKRHD